MMTDEDDYDMINDNSNFDVPLGACSPVARRSQLIPTCSDFRTAEKESRHNATVIIKLSEDNKGRSRAEHELIWKPASQTEVQTSPHNPDLKYIKLPQKLQFVFYGEVRR